MFSVATKKSVVDTTDFIVEEKEKLLKACSEVVILTEISKRGRLSAPDIIALFREKYDTQISPGTVYPILYRMERRRYIRLLSRRRKNLYILSNSGQKVLNELQLSFTEIQNFVSSLFDK